MDRTRVIQIHIWRWLRDGPDWVRAAMFGLFVLALIALSPGPARVSFQYEVGKQWRDKTLFAPFDFMEHKSEEQYQRDCEIAISQAYPVLVPDTAAWHQSRLKVLALSQQALAEIVRYEKARRSRDTAAVRTVFEDFFLAYFPKLQSVPNPDPYQAVVFSRYLSATLSQLDSEVYVRGKDWNDTSRYVFLRIAPGKQVYHPSNRLILGRQGLASFLASRRESTPVSPAYRSLADTLLVRVLSPNYRYSHAITQESRSILVSRVSRYRDLIKEKTLIIKQGELVNKKNILLLQSLEKEYQERFKADDVWILYLGRLVATIMITLLMVMYLKANRPQIYASKLRLSLILFLFLLVFGAISLVSRLDLAGMTGNESASAGNNWASLPFIYLAPACIIPIFIANFFGPRTGFISNILISLYGGVLIDQTLEYTFVQFMAGSVAVYSLRRLRSREMFFFSLAYIFLTYALSYFSFNLLLKGSFEELKYEVLVLLAVNVGVTIIAYNLIYLLEQLFGVTSDLTYLELLDMNHPIMKELAKRAPGTFQHSIQVAHIAEATINEIGGNALLVHVGAMYHDIGKMISPKYFIENLGDDEKDESPHVGMDCEESAAMIISHVRKGVELAQKNHLPREVIDFIQTHHGMTRVEYFYRLHLRELNCDIAEDEALYRYPGPLPFSKETAVVMICDSIEAASRAMKQPTQEKLKELVNNIIDHKIRDNQLENSSLTFKDIATIRRVVLKQMLTIFSSRIEYPKA